MGSQAILGQFPDAAADLLISNEADIYPKDNPDLADEIDAAIGENSHFHEQFGYYAEGVGPETAKLPSGWEERAFRLQNNETKGAVAICPEVHDLAASKLVAGREKDIEWIRSAFDAGILQRELIETRLWHIEMDPGILAKAEDRLDDLAPKGKSRD